jgi:hypothetical protein
MDAGPDSGAPAPARPDNPQALMEEINRTREELGDTVEALAAKVDVKARAQHKAAEVSGQLKGKMRDVKDELTGRAGQLRSELTGKADQSRQALAEGGKTVMGAGEPVTRSLANRAAQVGATAWRSAPEPVQRSAKRAARTVDQYRLPLAAAGVALAAGWLAVRWLRR